MNRRSPSSGTSSRPPSVDSLLRHADGEKLVARYGRPAATDAVRNVLAEVRGGTGGGEYVAAFEPSHILARVGNLLERESAPSLKRVFNLTGTVLHTNLGRALLPDVAVDAIIAVARDPANLEYDLDGGERGDRDDHVEARICRLTGAEAATVVNNNAAAVLLVLNSLARGREVPVSRGELIEIGGSFRIPDIMARSGCRLVEVGTTNRTHLHDYAEAIGPKTGMVMRVHTSNYSIEGFTASVPEPELSRVCRESGVPFAVDLGSGTLLDLRRYGLPHEPTPRESLANGADVVTFSGDKLLGGPQAGVIVGRAHLISKIRRNPLKRALRVDKMTVAALSAVLGLYFDPDRLAVQLPTLRLLIRAVGEIRAAAERVMPALAARVESVASVRIVECESQIGSGAQPTKTIASVGLAIVPHTARRNREGPAVRALAESLRALPIPVIGRVHEGSLILDLRCLEDETAFIAQLPALSATGHDVR